MKMPAKRSGHRDTTSLARPALAEVCPNAPECWRLWLTLPAPEQAALCGVCGQRLERDVLLAILYGWPA
jgi:hypothetical protein